MIIISVQTKEMLVVGSKNNKRNTFNLSRFRENLSNLRIKGSIFFVNISEIAEFSSKWHFI